MFMKNIHDLENIEKNKKKHFCCWQDGIIHACKKAFMNDVVPNKSESCYSKLISIEENEDT